MKRQLYEKAASNKRDLQDISLNVSEIKWDWWCAHFGLRLNTFEGCGCNLVNAVVFE